MFARRPEGTSIATHHVDIDTSVDDALIALQRIETEPYHALRVHKITLLGLGDDVEDLINWLTAAQRKPTLDSFARNVRSKGEDRPGYVRIEEHGAILPSQTRLPIRQFSLSNHRLTAPGLESFARLLSNHGSLTSLELDHSSAPPLPVPPMRSLALGVSQSLLRKLSLSSTPLQPEAFIALLDNLDAPCLQQLRLSLTMSNGNDSLDAAVGVKAAISVANLVRPKTSSPFMSLSDTEEARNERRHHFNDRTGGYAPQLEFLTLNGNCFTMRGIRIIVASAIGGPAWPANTTLTHLELFAATAPGTIDEDNDDDDDSVELHEAAGHTFLPPDDQRCFRHVTSTNWRFVLGRHLWRNVQNRSSIINAATAVLATSRILGCRSRESSERGSVSQFARLPPEVRMQIARSLDSDGVLSERQIRRVMTWASDPDTIGYGEPGKPLPWKSSASREFISLLPIQPWSWPDMFANRSLPRDWVAESWDASDETCRAIEGLLPEGVGGGGGPDGQGGATEDARAERRRRAPSSPPYRSRRTNRFSHIHAAPPALLAFLEATETRAVDSMHKGRRLK